jgi:thiol-disulfide isomerase/thioredoxin
VRSDEQAGLVGNPEQGIDQSRSTDAGASLSGNERDHLFLNLEGKKFVDVAGLSGLDHPGDGRAAALLDFDRDGWSDIVVVSANYPLTMLYRNQIGDLNRDSTGSQMVALRLIGGNHRGQPTAEWSNRDGYGAVVTLKVADRTIVREHRAGEGLAAQNSATIIIGTGTNDPVDSLVISWPSGKTQTVDNIAVGSLVSVFENPAHSPTGQQSTVEPYAKPGISIPNKTRTTLRRGLDVPWPLKSVGKTEPHNAELLLYTTVATWCEACRAELPQLGVLQQEFSPNQLAMIGVPYDENEDPDKLRDWAATYSPPYRIIYDLEDARIFSVQQYVEQVFRMDGLPVSIVTDSKGRVLLRKWGPPNVSEIEGLLMRNKDKQI